MLSRSKAESMCIHPFCPSFCELPPSLIVPQSMEGTCEETYYPLSPAVQSK